MLKCVVSGYQQRVGSWKLEAAESRKLVVVSETFLVSSRQLKRCLIYLCH
jgi:hypothetical protein